jgi:exodeoxyribonuclease X
MRLRVIDIETTGDAPLAEIIEIGSVDVFPHAGAWGITRPDARLFRPLHGIPPETMAVHHITGDAFGSESPVCSPERLKLAIMGNGEPPDVLVAHNSVFEQSFIGETITAGTPWICTYKSALRAWPDAPRHSNQVLRYWLGLKLDPDLAMPPHRAAPDAYVTAHILMDLLKVVSVDEMVAWTQEPKLLPVVPFGKHRGLKWPGVPIDYLQWIFSQDDMDPDILWNAQNEIQSRKLRPSA